MKLKEIVLNVLFPKRCAYCNKVLGWRDLCDDCIEQLEKYLIQGELQCDVRDKLCAVYAVYENSGIVKNAILNVKFHDNKEAHIAFAAAMVRYLFTFKFPQEFVIVPMPASKSSFKKRGFNLALLLADYISKEGNFLLKTNILFKSKDTKQQHTLGKSERAQNLKDSFSATHCTEIKDKNIVLIDDILTTGNTLNEAADTLLKAGASAVYGYCFASTPFIEIEKL